MMADNHSDTMEAVSSPLPAERPAPQIGKYKSFRKKYRKLKIRFDELADEAATLFQKENKITGITKRLQEENDQLLEIVLDLNDSDKIASYDQFDLRELATDQASERKKLANLIYEAQFTTAALSDIDVEKLPVDLRETDDGPLPGYLDVSHEEAYLNAIDTSLATLPSTEHLPGDVEAIQPNSSQEKHAVTVQDFTKSCAVSSYNWLKKHRPGALEGVGGGKDKDSDRGGSPKPKAKAKKQPKEKAFKEEADTFDEDGMDLSDYPPTNSRPKRKRDDDAYRPKGGSRPSKKFKKSQKGAE